MQDKLLDLQRSAGNRAVGLALRASPSANAAVDAQHAPAASNAQGAPALTRAATLQLGAIWQNLVVRPLARAHERLRRATPEPEEALREIDTALSGIASVKQSTPGGDANHVRLETLERKVRSFRDLAEESRGHGKSESNIERDLIAWRVEAIALQQAFGEAIGPRDDATAPSQWKSLVIDLLWQSQKQFEHSLSDGAATLRLAIRNADDFVQTIPNYKKLELYRLRASMYGTLSLLDARLGTDREPLIYAGIYAYETAAYVGNFLTGKPLDDLLAEPGQGGGGEPDFTWERPAGPVDNDTVLERPGD